MAASRQLVQVKAAHAARMADTAKAAEVAQRFTGWACWASRAGKAKVATRTGNPVDPDDDVWAASLVADDWDDLEQQLVVQAQHDAELTYVEVTQ